MINRTIRHLVTFYYFLIVIKILNLWLARLKFFELFDYYHPLDYKLYKTRIVNLTKEYTCIHISGSSSIFKASIIKAKKSPENISFYEDVRLINNYLLFKPIMGHIKEAIYYYRKRADFTSIT